MIRTKIIWKYEKNLLIFFLESIYVSEVERYWLLTKNRKKFHYQTTNLFKMFKTFSFIYPKGKQGHKIEFATNFGILNTIVLFYWSLETPNCKRSNLQNTLNKSMLNICSLGVKLSNCYNCFLRFSGFPD